MNICELIEANSSPQEPPETTGDQPLKEESESDKSSAAAATVNDNNDEDDEQGAQALTVTTSEIGSSETKFSQFIASNVDNADESTSSASSGIDSENKNDDDEDNNVYNRMIMFVNSNDEYGDQENSSTGGHHGGGQSSQFSILSSPIDEECQFDLLNPIEKFFKLCENPTPTNIENASKYVVPALEFASTQEEYARVFFYLRQYCFYSDVLLRSLWLDQIQNVIQYLHQELDNIRVEFTDEFNMSYQLAVLINDLMREQAYQVKKCATSAVLYIIEKHLLTNAQIEQLIIPSILNLVKENNEDFHIDCVSLFGKLAPSLGQELTSKYFLQPFCRLCSSPVFHTRKACASNIVEIANVISVEEVETFLIHHFCEFMKDQVWAIRKVCADAFSQFAMRCRRETRELVLTEHFIRLLDDNSRWVKIAAYKSLGPFIATFIRTETEKAEFLKKEAEKAAAKAAKKAIEESQTSDEKKEQIEATGTDVQGEEKQSKLAESSDNINNTKSDEIGELKTETTANEDVHMTDANASPASPPPSSDAAMPSEEQDSNEMSSNSPNKDSDYSDFMFWRNLVPIFDKSFPSESQPSTRNNNENSMDSSSSGSRDANSIANAENKSQDSSSSSSASQLPTLSNLLESSNLLEPQLNRVSIYSSSNNLSSVIPLFGQLQAASSIEKLSNELKQDIVPPTLLGHFITMVEINTQNSLDSEMNYNCAFNFPAIALTLGVEHWQYIKNLYKKLAEDVSWKVRQTLAYSIHELAIILGTEITQTDLVPIFDSYIKDVDEVRIGIVANLTKFLRVLSLECRCSYMPKLNDFLKMDNQRNWRFRNELGLQIAEFCPLFPPDCLAEYVQPVAFTLALDKISEVRLTAINALIEIFKQFEATNKLDLRRNFVDDVIRTFANSNRWTFRQLYVIMCENLLKYPDQVDFDAFCRDFLPKLFSFRNEKVPNIRLLLARFIATHLVNNERFAAICCVKPKSWSDGSQDGGETKTSQLQSELDLTIHYLANDKESDVKCYFQSTHSTNINDESCNNNNNESKQIMSGDVSMEIGPSSTAGEHANTMDETSSSPELPKIDSSSLSLSAAVGSATSDQESTIVTSKTPAITKQDESQKERQSGASNEDDEEEWDEVVDKTKIDKLKIVNLDNEMDDEMDIIIESKETINHINKDELDTENADNSSNA